MPFNRHAGLLCGLVAWLGVPLWGQVTPGVEALPIASFDVEGTRSRGVSVEHGRAAISSSGDVGATERPVDVHLSRGGNVRVCKGSDLHVGQDSAALSSRASDGLVFSLPRNAGALETHYPTGKYSDVLLTPDLQFLISGPGTAELKVSVDAQRSTCVENAGENAPYVTASSRTAGGAYRVGPGQRVIFTHGLLGAAMEGSKQLCGCEFAGVYETATHLEQTIAAADLRSAPARPTASPAAPLLKTEGSTTQTKGNIAQGTGGRSVAVSSKLLGFVPPITSSYVTNRNLYARSQKVVFLSAAHKSWLKVRNMDAYLETDVLIMIFAVAITITLSVLMQAVVCVLLFRVCKSAVEKLVWAAEDVKEKLIPAAETAQEAAREFMPLLHSMSYQLGKISHLLEEGSISAEAAPLPALPMDEQASPAGAMAEESIGFSSSDPVEPSSILERSAMFTGKHTAADSAWIEGSPMFNGVPIFKSSPVVDEAYAARNLAVIHHSNVSDGRTEIEGAPVGENHWDCSDRQNGHAPEEGAVVDASHRADDNPDAAGSTTREENSAVNASHMAEDSATSGDSAMAGDSATAEDSAGGGDSFMGEGERGSKVEGIASSIQPRNGAGLYPRPVRKVYRTSVFRPKRMPEPSDVAEAVAN